MNKLVITSRELNNDNITSDTRERKRQRVEKS